jgi:hypothetical protein
MVNGFHRPFRPSWFRLIKEKETGQEATDPPGRPELLEIGDPGGLKWNP